MTDDQSSLIERLPEDGSTLNRYEVQKALDWDDERFLAARDDLKAAGRVYVTRGRGGPLGLVVEEGMDEGAVDRVREDTLYTPMADQLQNKWAPDRQFDAATAIVTARQGRRNTGGRWTRPDIVVVAKRKFRHRPVTTLEVVSFEVKASDSIDVTAVYEALAHRNRSTSAFVLAHCSAYCPALAPVRVAAETHGVGLIAAEVPEDFSTWDEVAAARTHEPDPTELEAFIEVQLVEAHGFIDSAFA